MKQLIPLAISKQICYFPSKAKKNYHLCLYICVGEFCPDLLRFMDISVAGLKYLSPIPDPDFSSIPDPGPNSCLTFFGCFSINPPNV